MEIYFFLIYNFDYKLDFDKEGHNIELEVDHNIYSGDSRTDNSFSGFIERPNFYELNYTDRERTTINLDYVNPLSDKTKLELGLQARLFDNTISYFSNGRSENEIGQYIPSTTDFDYNRNIFSAYATYSKKFEKWSYQVGLRAETVDVETLAKEVDLQANLETVIPFDNDYFKLYPSAFFTFTPSEKNAYQLSYSRRVDRPSIGQVNPIREWSTPQITSVGNPNLKPQFTNSFELNYTRQYDKGSFTFGTFYRRVNDNITRILNKDPFDENNVEISYSNAESNNRYGVELSSNHKLADWWRINSSFDLYTQKESGIANNEQLEVTSNSINFRVNNTFKATKNLNRNC